MTAVLERTESLLLALETVYFKNYGMVSKEYIDQINTTGHGLNVCISIYKGRAGPTK